jgi:hypothetical protein
MSKINNIATMQNAVEQVEEPGSLRTTLQINPIRRNVCTIREPGASNDRLINIKENTGRVIRNM